MKIWDEIKMLTDEVGLLEKAVEREVRPAAVKSREFMTLFVQEVEVDQYDMRTRQAVFQNGDIDTLEICRLAMTVAKNVTPTTQPNRRTMLARAPQGWIEASATAGLLGLDIDVRWNTIVGSRATRYSRDHFCNSDMLVGLDRGQGLDLRVPFILPRGEQLEFYVEPIAFAIPTGSGSVTPGEVKFYVQFHGMGRRRSA